MTEEARRKELSNFFHGLLQSLLEKKGTDLFLMAGFPAAYKVNGELHKSSEKSLIPQDTADIASILMKGKFREEFKAHGEVNFAIRPQGLGRFRVNIFMQQSTVGIVLRVIRSTIPSIEELFLPEVLKELVLHKRGMILVVGATGSGKSTALAAMVGHRNRTTANHIITIEDPIEFLHTNHRSIISQREIGVDTESWGLALKNSLRQSPDVIVVGEVRDREAMEYVLMFSETGHLCLSTLHANNASHAIERLINLFSEDRRSQLLMDIALNLRAVISLRLIRREDQMGMVPAVEVMMNSPLISDLILKGNISAIKEVMHRNPQGGMQTFEHSLFHLYESGTISYESALQHADSMNDLRLELKLRSKRKGPGFSDDRLMMGVV